MFFSLAHITGWLLHYRYLVLFPLVVAEGPIVTVIAGSLASVKILNFLITYLVIVIGDVTGDSLYYAFGRFGRHSFINKWGHYVGISPARIQSLESHFSSHGWKTLIFGKLTHALGAPILVAAGIAKVPFERFILFNFLATLIKSMALLLVGFYFVQTFFMLAKYSDYATAGLISLLLVTFFVFIIRKKIKNIRKDKI